MYNSKVPYFRPYLTYDNIEQDLLRKFGEGGFLLSGVGGGGVKKFFVVTQHLPTDPPLSQTFSKDLPQFGSMCHGIPTSPRWSKFFGQSTAPFDSFRRVTSKHVLGRTILARIQAQSRPSVPTQCRLSASVPTQCWRILRFNVVRRC